MLSLIDHSQLEIFWPLFLAPLPLLVYYFLPPHRETSVALAVPFLDRLKGISGESHRRDRRFGVSFWTLLLVWLLCLVAMSRPVLLGEAVELPGKARDLYLAVDISGSMEERDMVVNNRAVSRIQLVKHVLSEFIQRREGDRIGLILFADNAYIQAPLTFDLQTVAQLMQEAQLGFAGQKTAIGEALGLGIKQLVDRPASSRTIILLTDGANNAGNISPDEAANVAKENLIRIHTVAIAGNPAMRGGLFGASILPGRSANIDERALHSIAEKTGGQYFRADNSAELEKIYRELDKLEPVDQEAQLLRPRKQLFYWPLGAALLLVTVLGAFRLVPEFLAAQHRRAA